MMLFHIHQSNTRRTVFGLILFLLSTVPLPAMAFRLQGQVINGTLGTPAAGVSVLVVKPSDGMMVEKEIVTDGDGRFAADNLDDSAALYLVRVPFQGVNYTELIETDGTDPVTLQMDVYEPTSSWEGIQVSIPHLLVTRSADTLMIDKFYQVRNESSPPRTLTGDEGRFAFHVPDDALAILSCFVRSLGIPLPQTPVRDPERGFHYITHPIKPGDTQISLALALPYAAGAYTYREKLEYGVDRMMIVMSDPSIEVTRDGAPLERNESHGFTAYQLADLEAGSELVLRFSGGATAAAAAHRVRVVQNRTNQASIALMIALGIALLGLLGFAARRHSTPEAEARALAVQKESMLGKLARLDDLHKTGTVSDRMYDIMREDLVNALAQIYYRTEFAGAAVGNEEERQEGAARV